MIEHIVLIIYALFLILGAWMGFKKGSQISLIVGLSSGFLVLLGTWFLTTKPQMAWIFLSGLLFVLSVSFLTRFLKTRKFMPSGMLLGITLSVLFFCVLQLLKTIMYKF